MVGRRWKGWGHWRYYLHFQFGVESNKQISETAWKELNNHASYYDGASWRYLPGITAWGAFSWITWKDGVGVMRVCGSTYVGVNKEYSSNDMVCWKQTGTTIGHETYLWVGSGTVSDTVSKPYQ